MNPNTTKKNGDRGNDLPKRFSTFLLTKYQIYERM
jgi:hypothetical protein